MKRFFRLLVLFLVLAGLGGGGYGLFHYWRHGRQPNYRFAEVSRGPIVAVVNATGTVQPVLSVSVGSFVSGPIEELKADFNDIVQKDQVLARIDPRIYKAAVDRDLATLATRRAEVKRVEALLAQARNDERRAIALQKVNRDFISDAEMDQFRFKRMSLEADLEVAKAAVIQAEANLENSRANLAYTEIKSPVAGIIINRKIDQGQTLAAQFQTPELFVVAPDLKTRMYIHASVDEADIGLIKTARDRKYPIRFTVDAYPNDLFAGEEIVQIRMNSTTTQNVVTYPVVVAVPNPELKLMPGMTATLSFQVAELKDTLRIPNAALRFYPQKEQVRPEDRKLLEGTPLDTTEDSDTAQARRSAAEKAEARRQRHLRHVWVVEGEFLRAVEVRTGLSDNRFTQLVEGNLSAGQQLVTGIRTGE